MPGNMHSPPVLLLAEADWRQHRGVNLFSMGGVPVQAPATAGVYEDLLQALNYYASQPGASLRDIIQAQWNASGSPATTFTVGITSTDRVFIHSSAQAFQMMASAGWGGLPSVMTPSSVTGGGGGGAYGPGHVVVGTSDWSRGPFRGGPGGDFMIVAPPVGPFIVAPDHELTATCLPVLLLTAAGGDECLENWTNDAIDPASRRIRWGINADGKVYYTRPNGVGGLISWLSDTCRNEMGFTGLEVEIVDGNHRIMTATYEPAQALLASGLRRCHPYTDDQVDVIDLRSGSVATQDFGVWRGYEIEVYLRGPAMGHTDVTNGDQTRQYLDRFLACAKRGHGLNVYRHWGDTRLALPWRSVTADQPAYSATHTSERDGARGCLRCLRVDEETRRVMTYDGMPEVRSTVSFVLRSRA